MRQLALLFGVFALGCGIRLDEPTPKQKSKVDVPVVEACRWFEGSGTRVAGRVSSVLLGDGNRLFIAGNVAGVENVSFVVPESATPDDCFANATRIDPAVLPLGDQVLTSVLVEGVPWVYFARFDTSSGNPFPERAGIGVARWDANTLTFVPSEPLLWTGDRPSFGSGALVDAGYVYVYGCQEGGFLSSDCFIARAPTSAIDDESAYEYYAGGSHFTAAVDDAFQVFEAGDPVAVMAVPGRERFLAAYVTPLGEEVTLRSGLGAFGPWSKPQPSIGCDVGPDAFCADTVLHAFDGRLFVSYSILTFEAGKAEADPEAFWSRLAPVDVPGTLP